MPPRSWCPSCRGFRHRLTPELGGTGGGLLETAVNTCSQGEAQTQPPGPQEEPALPYPTPDVQPPGSEVTGFCPPSLPSSLFSFLCSFLSLAGSCSVAKAGLELVILLPQPPECWDYRCAPPHPENFCFLPCTVVILWFSCPQNN
jgi:hypothetical protein